MKSQHETDSESELKRAESVVMREQEAREGKERAERPSLWKRLTVDEVLLSSLIILSVLGAGISQISVSAGGTYWLVIIPIIAAAIIHMEWAKVRWKGVKWLTLARTQLYHWGPILVSVELVGMLSYYGRITNEAVSFVTLILVAQAMFLAGVYVDWRFAIVALFQALCMIVLAYLATYSWAVFIIAIVIIGLGAYFHRKFPGEFSSLRR
jgi:hypothetical protein